MILDYEPGDKVTNPNNKVTVNYENAGKKVINAKNIELRKLGK